MKRLFILPLGLVLLFLPGCFAPKQAPVVQKKDDIHVQSTTPTGPAQTAIPTPDRLPSPTKEVGASTIWGHPEEFEETEEISEEEIY